MEFEVNFGARLCFWYTPSAGFWLYLGRLHVSWCQPSPWRCFSIQLLPRFSTAHWTRYCP